MRAEKKIFRSIIILSLFALPACSGSKEARTMKKEIRGDWTLKSITIEGNPSIMGVNVFNEADNSCFTGSSWHFVANNGTGSYTLPAGTNGCEARTRKIKWRIYEPTGEEKKFQFKRLDDNNNPLDDNNGYRLRIASLTDHIMELQSSITYNTRPVTITYNFEKN